VSDQDLPPAGWYPDPDVPGGERYWDGVAWSEHRRAGAPPASPWGSGSEPASSWQQDGSSGEPAGGGSEDPAGGSAGGQPGGPAWQTAGGAAGGPPGGPAWQTAGGAGAAGAAGAVDTWMWQSIVATILCCQPLGIVAIVMSAQASSARDAGNLELARKRAGQARTWTFAAVGAFFVLFLPATFIVLFA
jgi:hypothetical protein